MPIYEYRCGSCGFQKEFLQKMSDPQLKDCPECGKPTLSKMVTAAGFQLKGSGWYATDFKHGPSSKPKSTDKPAAKSDDTSGAKAETKADSKPATETAAKTADAPAAKATPVVTPATGS